MPVFSLFSIADFFFFPLAIWLLFVIVKATEKENGKVLLTAFWFHVILVIIHALVIDFYYGGGDTTRFYLCLHNIRRAMDDNIVSRWDILSMTAIDPDSQVSYYFRNDAMRNENYYYMQSSTNYTVVKICFFFSMFFGTSYLAISLCFTTFALIGSWLLCKTLLNFFPLLKKEFFLAVLFLPTVMYWSSSILKDPVTFGSLGFIAYGCYQIAYKKKIVVPLLAIVIPAYLTYMLKTYVLLSFAPSVILLIVISKTQGIKNPTAKRAMYAVALLSSVALGALLYQNITSSEHASAFKAESLFEKIDAQRGVYGEQEKEGTAYFQLPSSSTTSPILLFPAGLVATYYRPFLWEVGNPVMALSAVESLFFLLLTLYVFKKVGIINFFKIVFTNPVVLFCFIFAILFGGAVGASTANFGSLVRYKIPAMPFYLIMLIVIMHVKNVKYPTILIKPLNLIRLNYVRHSRVY